MTRAEDLARYGVAHHSPEALEEMDQRDFDRIARAVRHEWHIRQIGVEAEKLGVPQNEITSARCRLPLIDPAPTHWQPLPPPPESTP